MQTPADKEFDSPALFLPALSVILWRVSGSKDGGRVRLGASERLALEEKKTIAWARANTPQLLSAAGGEALCRILGQSPSIVAIGYRLPILPGSQTAPRQDTGFLPTPEILEAIRREVIRAEEMIQSCEARPRQTSPSLSAAGRKCAIELLRPDFNLTSKILCQLQPV